jgi:hypothetical protein
MKEFLCVWAAYFIASVVLLGVLFGFIWTVVMCGNYIEASWGGFSAFCFMVVMAVGTLSLIFAIGEKLEK